MPNESGRCALLGLLSLKPMCGYDLRRLIQYSIGHFWSESFGQIYPTLHALAAEGLVRPARHTATKGNRERQVYAITDGGRATLKAWLPLPTRTQTPRNELLLKLFFGVHAPPGTNEAHIQKFREDTQKALTAYCQTEQQLSRAEANHPELPYWLMTLRYGRMVAAAELAWIDEALGTLQSPKQGMEV